MRQPRQRPRGPHAGICVPVLLAAVIASGPVRAAAQAFGPEAIGFAKHFALDIINPSPLTLEDQAIVIDVDAIRAAVAPDFNTYMYALFDNARGEYALVVSQADDLDGDRYHDEIALVRTLPPSSTTRLLCYYTPERSYQLMATPKAFARGGWEPGGVGAGWESNLAAYKFAGGRIGFYGKVEAGLILRTFPAAETGGKEWGLEALDLEGSAGLGGLSLWDGAGRVPLYGPSSPTAELTVISPGPVRALVKAEYPAVKTAAGEIVPTVFYSAFADNAYSRQDLVLAPKSGAGGGTAVTFGPGIRKLTGETSSLEPAKGYIAAWGRGAAGTGEIGLAVVFEPGRFAGLDEGGPDRFVELKAPAGVTSTYWVVGAWERGVSAPASPDAKGWARRVADLASRLLTPVKVEFKAP